MKYCTTLLLIVCSGFCFAQQIDGEIELGGFVLGQFRKNVYAELGPPIQVSRYDGWVYEFHKIKPDTSVYALFKYEPSDTTRIFSIQLSGRRFAEMLPFRGLTLGAPKAEVDRVLGPPEKVEKLTDPPATLQYYANKNYSVDIDSHDRLYSLQIFGSILRNKPPTTEPSIRGFREAILSRNIDSLVHYLHPGVQLVKGETVYEFSGAARTDLNRRDSEFTELLLGDTGSVWYTFAQERAEGTPHPSVHEESGEVMSTDKFFDSNIVDEVLLKAHAGKWKVFQVVFR